MEKPKRKHPRLKNYDYSLPGYYYVTIHTNDSEYRLSTVGRTADPAGEAVLKLTKLGEIAQRQLLELEGRYPCVKIDKFVIMPTHIHAIIQLGDKAAGASPRPTLMEVIQVYKSLTTRLCNQLNQTPGRKLFQTSFYETVLRNERAYQECWRYIDDNSAKWLISPDE